MLNTKLKILSAEMIHEVEEKFDLFAKKVNVVDFKVYESKRGFIMIAVLYTKA